MADSLTPKPTRPNSTRAAGLAGLPLNPVVLQLQAWTQQFPFPEAATLAVAYSGGADSTALLHAAALQWPGQVRAIHIHHGLQAAADDFVRHCGECGRQLALEDGRVLFLVEERYDDGDVRVRRIGTHNGIVR